ncbi:flagellar hook-length control protein FliK [Photobacterium indicum]|nr:flagellar hook-length control protein FliK [Photobacterium indicum]
MNISATIAAQQSATSNVKTSHVAEKSVSSNKASSSTATSDVKPNELDGDSMSFAQFEQKIKQQPEQSEEPTKADDNALPTAEELALQIEQLLAQVADPAAQPQAALLANGQLANGQAEAAKTEALALAQQVLAASTATLAQPLSTMNPLPGQALPTGADKAALLESAQQFLTQNSDSFAQVKAGDGSFALAKNAVMSRDGSLLSADNPMTMNETALMDKLANALLPTSSTSPLAMNVASNINSNTGQVLNGQSPSQLVAASSSVSQQLQASVDITKPEWGRDLVEQLRSRLQLSKSDQIQHAHIRLDPPELGRLDVSLRMDGDKVSVHFTAAHPQLREALATNADRLRFDFDGSQMQLTDVSVSSGMYQQSQQQSGQRDEPEIMTNQFITASEKTDQRSAMATSVGRYESMI